MKVGDIYEASTYAGVIVQQKVVGFYKSDPTGEHYVAGVLVRAEDVVALKEAGVPYKGTEDPAKCKGVLYRSKIIRQVEE